MQVAKLTREFLYNAVKLLDPDPTHTPEQVKNFYSALYPEIVSATVDGPESKGSTLVYSIRKNVGTKG